MFFFLHPVLGGKDKIASFWQQFTVFIEKYNYAHWDKYSMQCVLC